MNILSVTNMQKKKKILIKNRKRAKTFSRHCIVLKLVMFFRVPDWDKYADFLPTLNKYVGEIILTQKWLFKCQDTFNYIWNVKVENWNSIIFF